MNNNSTYPEQMRHPDGVPPGPRPPAPGPRRETHLAKKRLQMRLPISDHHRNPLKQSSLKPHE